MSAPPSPLTTSPKHAVASFNDQRAYDFALRDAAARFDETCRLAAEMASLQQQLIQSHTAHELEMTQAAEREAMLSAQLSAAQQDAKDGASREVVELGARAQVADWRARQSQRQAEDAETERRRAVDAMRATEADSIALRSELTRLQLLQESVREAREALVLREAELSRTLVSEREERKADIERLSGAAMHTVSEAKAEAAAARRECNDLRCELESRSQVSSVCVL